MVLRVGRGGLPRGRQLQGCNPLRAQRLKTIVQQAGRHRHSPSSPMTLAHGTDRLESARLMLRPITPDDLPFFTRLHALPKVAQHLYPGGRPRTRQETAEFLRSIFVSYAQLALGYLAVVRNQDGALIGRCG